MSGITDLWRTGRGCCLAIVALALLLLLGACVALGWGVAKWTEAAEEPGLDVMMLIDQSGSLWELGGVGTDPQMLRMEGARLFAATLGVDGAANSYRLGAMYFGSQPRLIAPLTPLTGPGNGREALLAALAADPQPMGWTDVNAALALAYDELFMSERAEPDRLKALVLFTDGRPQTEALTTPAATQAYLDALHEQIQAFTDQGAVVYAVLLSNAASDADPLTRDVYRPLWVELAEAGKGVSFYDARSSQDLAPIYHDIVAQLHRSSSQGMVLRETVQDALEATVDVAAGWQSATFVVHKSVPGMQVVLVRPNGQVVSTDAPGVRYSGQLDRRYETWTIDQPAAGQWRVQITGRGAVAVWLDYQLLPATPTASPTATPSPTATRSATRTASSPATAMPGPSPTATATPLTLAAPRLEIMQPQPGTRYAPGAAAAVLIEVASVQPDTLAVSVAGGDLAGPQVITLTQDIVENGIYWQGQSAPLHATGNYTLTVSWSSELGRGVVVHEQRQVPFTVAKRTFPAGWLAGAGLGLAAAAVVGHSVRRRRSRPHLAGVLRLTRGPAGQTVGQSWDLSAGRRQSATLGSGSRCDVLLAHDPQLPAQAAVIQISSQSDAGSAPLLIDLTPEGRVRINSEPIVKQAALRDGDAIELGAYHLRYENLALRRQAQKTSPPRRLTDLDLGWPDTPQAQPVTPSTAQG